MVTLVTVTHPWTDQKLQSRHFPISGHFQREPPTQCFAWVSISVYLRFHFELSFGNQGKFGSHPPWGLGPSVVVPPVLGVKTNCICCLQGRCRTGVDRSPPSTSKPGCFLFPSPNSNSAPAPGGGRGETKGPEPFSSAQGSAKRRGRPFPRTLL